MAVSDISVPSFDVTKDEKVENENHINSLLRRSADLLDSYRKESSPFDLHDASLAVQDALFIANDPGACESPPLAVCYLHQGHVLEAMNKYIEARNAYRKATRVPSRSSLDHTASEQAAGWAAKMDQKVRDGKRKGGIWTDAYQKGSSATAQIQPHLKLPSKPLEKGPLRRETPSSQLSSTTTPS
ncbi:hypothetical protein F4804DRAFT_333259 [Jackrogersella minutella]|nr:hypothetical protein F4804DRAFT_333259 [Jackrogersella minutella]